MSSSANRSNASVARSPGSQINRITKNVQNAISDEKTISISLELSSVFQGIKTNASQLIKFCAAKILRISNQYSTNWDCNVNRMQHSPDMAHKKKVKIENRWIWLNVTTSLECVLFLDRTESLFQASHSYSLASE